MVSGLLYFALGWVIFYVPSSYIAWLLRRRMYRRFDRIYPMPQPRKWQYGTGWWEFPTFWGWHTLTDGTWVCNCTRSKEMKARASRG